MTIAKINEINTVIHCVKLVDETGAHRLWDGWSATTARHINKAIGRKLTKKEWDVMPVEEY